MSDEIDELLSELKADLEDTPEVPLYEDGAEPMSEEDKLLNELRKEMAETERNKDSVLATVNNYAGGVNNSIADLFELPTHAVNGVIGLVNSGVDKAAGRDVQDIPKFTTPGFTQSFRDMFGAKPETRLQRVAASSGKLSGEALQIMFGGAGLAKGLGAEAMERTALTKLGPKSTAAIEKVAGKRAASIAAGTVAAPSAVKEAGKQGIRTLMANPGKVAAAEVGVASAAGAGGQVAVEMFPTSEYARLVGELSAGLSPGVLTKLPTSQVIKGVVNRVNPEAIRNRVAEKAANTLAIVDDADIIKSIEDVDKLKKVIPGFEPSLAETTNSQRLLNAQNKLEMEAKGDALDVVIARHQRSKEAIEEFALRETPEGGHIDVISDELTGRIESISSKLDAEIGKTSASREGIVGEIPAISKELSGNDMRDALNSVRRVEKARMDSLLSELNLDTIDIKDSFKDFGQFVLDKYKPRSGAFRRIQEDSIPEHVKDISAELARLQNADEVFTFADMKTFRQDVGDSIRNELGAANPNAAKARLLTELRDDVDEYLMEGAGQGLAQEAAGNYKAWRDVYFNEFVKKFKTGVAHKALDKDGRGFYRTSSEKLTESFWKGAETENIKQYINIFGDTDVALKPVLDSMLDDLAFNAVKDGVLDTTKVSNWLKKYGTTLDAMPTVKRTILDKTTRNTALMKRRATLTDRTKAVENSALNKALSTLAKSKEGFLSTTKDMGTIVQNALSDPDTMNSLVKVTQKSPEATNALRRAIFKGITEAKDIDALMKANKDSLEKVFTPKHLENISVIQKAREIASRTRAPIGKVDTSRPFQKIEDAMGGMSIPQLLTRGYAIQTGRVGKAYPLVEGTVNFLRGYSQRELDKVLTTALYDPDVAKLIVENSIKPISVRGEDFGKLNAWIFSLGRDDGRELALDRVTDEDIDALLRQLEDTPDSNPGGLEESETGYRKYVPQDTSVPSVGSPEDEGTEEVTPIKPLSFLSTDQYQNLSNTGASLVPLFSRNQAVVM